jgi:hypothetical protein
MPCTPDSFSFQKGRPLILARIQGLNPNLTETVLSNFKVESTMPVSPSGDVVDLFISPSEPSILNFVLRLADLAGVTQQQNVTFRLVIPDINGGGLRASVVPFGFLYVPSAAPSLRLINSISVTQGSILGGTPVVVMLR